MAELTKVESPADINTTWVLYCCCSGFGISCEEQCNPCCESSSKCFCCSSVQKQGCNAPINGPDGLCNSTAIGKVLCLDSLSQMKVMLTEVCGESGWLNCSSTQKQLCCLMSSGCKAVDCGRSFENGCLVSNSKTWFCLMGHDYFHKMFIEVCGARICGPPKPPKQGRFPAFFHSDGF